ncbi:MAG: organoarsenical effux MFS transporter ArsJ [Methylophaga sp.]|nr:organoarsenical effux MFS transporter ArsJ [Methylophaga sp.]
MHSLRNYALITGGYWAFTLTDGAIRMLVVLYFHQLGYSPLAIASLFVFYEFFGIITNLVGGWLGARFGLNTTMLFGMALQIFALLMLTVPIEYLTLAFVMMAQALSGIAKDLNKMSAKASIKLFVPDNADGSKTLFKWIAILTGSKNTLKGIGFFLGGLLLATVGFKGALYILAGGLFIILCLLWLLLPRDLGKTKNKAKFSQLFSNTAAINWLSAARFFLFGSRDVWFVVGLPVYLATQLGWGFEQIGAFFALWVIGYGLVQTAAPALLKYFNQNVPDGRSTRNLAFYLMLIPVAIATALHYGLEPNSVIILGLTLFAIIFALNSAVHSYLIVEWSDHDKVAMNVGFYYMANAGGRLMGTILSGYLFQKYGLSGCLIASSLFIMSAALLSQKLPHSMQET